MKKRSLPPSSLDSDPIIVQPKKRHRERKVNPNPSAKRTSIYKGVTRHRCTGRFEAHLWDKDSWNSSQTKKGRQIYLGAYDLEEVAARSYDLAALKYWGSGSVLNFSIESYINELEEMKKFTKEEYLISLRRNSNGFSRGISKYRGVAKHHQNGRWEARIGRVMGNKYFYLGTYGNQEEAAMAYDIAAIDHRGPNTITNFDISIYAGLLIDKSQNAFAYKRADEITDVEMNTYGNRVKEQAEKAFYRIKHANQYQNLEVSNNYSVQEPVDNGNELVVPMTAVVEPIASGTMEVPTYEEDYYNEESLSHLCRDPAVSMNDNSLSSVFGNPTIEPRNETPALYVVDNSSTWIDEIDFVFNLPVMDRHDQILLLFNRTLYGGYGFDDLLFDDIILNVEDMISTPVHSPVSSDDSFSDQYLIEPVSI